MVDEEKSASIVGKYEITFILEEGSTPENVLKTFTKDGIEQEELKDLGVKRFAYKIKKMESGHYFSMVFLAAKNEVAQLERDLRLEREIVRHLIVKVEHERMKALHEQKQAARNMKKAAAAMEEKTAADAKKEAPAPRPQTSIEVKKVEEKPAEIAIDEKPAVKEVEEKTKEEKPAKTAKKAEPKAKEKPKAVKKPKEAKIAKAELDKKLEELVED